jgi:hypothetical protein
MNRSGFKTFIAVSIFAIAFAGIYINNAAQSPTVISLTEGNSTVIYNTTFAKIDTYDISCQFDEEYTGIPVRIESKNGEMNDRIVFSDNYTVITMGIERYDWKNYQGKVIKIKKSCYGYLQAIEIQPIK